MIIKTVVIPNKLYFRIGEVADLLGVKPYVLRYWETEFPDIKPAKSKSGQRLYKRRDVELLVRIKQLLYLERFTINGARKRLKDVMRENRGHEAVHQMPLELPKEEIPSPPRPKRISQPQSQPTLDNRKILLGLGGEGISFLGNSSGI